MSIYKSYDYDHLQELFSNYLISNWSFSKVNSFARNEKFFEMVSIFGLYGKDSASSIAGNAYHTALQYYFAQKKEGKTIDIVELEAAAFQYIESVSANKWKLQKTTPTVAECVQKATKTATALLRNFQKEKSVYEEDIAEILDVEIEIEEFLTVNGVDIPLPCRMKLDLVVKTKTGKVAIVDHKSKAVFSPDEELALGIGPQAITYVLGYEARDGVKVDEVWFVENKYSQNKDGKPQLNKFDVQIDDDTRRLYESLLYEPLRRMLSAVSDPDYVYLINPSDNFVSQAELYDFWCRTQIQEVEDFNVEETKKELVAKRLKKIRDASVNIITPQVIKKFKENASQFIQYDLSNTNMTKEEKIEHVLRTFGKIVKVAHTFDGYSSNTYLLEVSAGVKATSIHAYRLDIANALDVPNVRISSNLVVYEGKSYLAVEIAKKRDKTLFFDESEQKGWKIPLGKDNMDRTVYWDLDNHSTPHSLVCGSTGSGKSVLIRTVIEYAKIAGVSDIIILDPKYEFVGYTGKGVQVVNEILDIEEKMKDIVDDMNHRVKHNMTTRKTLIIFDEFADAIDRARKGKELDVYEMAHSGFYATGVPKMAKTLVGRNKSLEENMKIILQKGRSTGFRILGALQRASTKIINGDAKANFSVLVCFKMPKEVDSRVVLDEAGAESLAGFGDGLIKSPEYPETVRFQAFYKPEKEMA